MTLDFRRRRRPRSRFLLHRASFSNVWRVDLAVPAADPACPAGHAYAGTLRVSLAEDGRELYEGPVQAADPHICQRDLDLTAATVAGDLPPAYLMLVRLPPSNSRQRHKRFAGALHLASGRYIIEAASISESQIIGRITRLGGDTLHDRLAEHLAATLRS